MNVSSVTNGANYPYASASQSSQTSTAASFASAMATAQASSTSQADSTASQPDFSSMTCQQLRDWANNEFLNKKITLDQDMAFGMMTMKIPVNGTPQDLNGTKYNFVQEARDGIAGALSRNDATSLTMLESAMSVMQQQGQSSSANASA